MTKSGEATDRKIERTAADLELAIASVLAGLGACRLVIEVDAAPLAAGGCSGSCGWRRVLRQFRSYSQETNE